jgi:DNA adenine methylase
MSCGIEKEKANHIPNNNQDLYMRFLRYAGGKQRLVRHIMPYLPARDTIKGKFIEPFLGSGAVFFALNPESALLSDIDQHLIDLYRGIKYYPSRVWSFFKAFPVTRTGYYKIRKMNIDDRDLAFRSARILYLNRTCFKGMWRHNSNGQFNVGYGGQDRRWIVTEQILLQISKRLKNAILKCGDFEKAVRSCKKGDFIFVDPPYCPGKYEVTQHYRSCSFKFTDYKRLASILTEASKNGSYWAMTISSHPAIMSLFKGNRIIKLPLGTGPRPGLLTLQSEEVLVCNY